MKGNLIERLRRLEKICGDSDIDGALNDAVRYIERLQRQLAARSAQEADAARLTREDARCLEIGRAVDRACGELPEGFDLHIELENGAGTVRLYLPDTDADMSDFDDHDTFGGQINAAIDAALSSAKENSGE